MKSIDDHNAAHRMARKIERARKVWVAHYAALRAFVKAHKAMTPGAIAEFNKLGLGDFDPDAFAWFQNTGA